MPQRSTSVTIPAATGGWNARDLIDAMAATDALELENMIPSTGGVDLRRGSRVHQADASTSAVRSLFSFNGTDGTNKLLAATNANIYDVTTLAGTPSSKASGLTNNNWQGLNFKGSSNNGVLIMVNGEDGVLHYNGSSISDESSNYSGPTVADLVQVEAYRHRLYFVPVDSTSVWYGGTNQQTGTLTEFDIGSLLTEGGYLLFVASWSHESGAGLEDYLVFVSSEGEGLVYAGNYPHASDWRIVKHFYVGKSPTRRSYTKKEGDLILITANGLLPLSEVFSPSGSGGTLRYFTDKVQDAFSKDYRGHSSNFGWDAIYYKRGNLLLFNMPLVEDSLSYQYVMNTLTGAWCRFTDWNISSWAIHNDKLYFGGMDGSIYEADYGHNDNGNPISIKYKQAFNYLGDRNRLKHFNLGRPKLTANSNLTFLFDVNVDGEDEPVSGTATTSASISNWAAAGAAEPLWDVAEWSPGDIQIADWYSLTGVGRSCAPKLRGDFLNVKMSLSSFDLNYIPGGVL
jgi:hypothetical protein